MPPSISSAAFVSVPFAPWRFTMANNLNLTADANTLGSGAADPPEALIDL
jgi:hypothetical protein